MFASLFNKACTQEFGDVRGGGGASENWICRVKNTNKNYDICCIYM